MNPPSTLHRGARLSLHVALTALVAIFFGPLAAVLFGVLNPNSLSPVLGVSYPVINTTRLGDLTAQNAAVQEQLWVNYMTNDDATMWQTNPFMDNLTGPLGSGKFMIQIKEASRVRGNIVNIPTMAGLGGPGVAGEGNRIGAEQKAVIGNFQLQVGQYWFGYGFTSVARDQTVIGSEQDRKASDWLRYQVAKKKSDDVMMSMINVAQTSGPNYMLPSGFGSRDSLTSAAVMSTATISRLNSRLQGNGGAPVRVGKDDSGSAASKYILLGTADGLTPLNTESAYLEALNHADVRGANNGIFTGEYRDWLGTGIYRWEQINHANRGSIGSPLLPRARLGNAITSGTVITGGGSAAAAAATPAPQYFEFFSNAPYTFTNNLTIAATTATQRYINITSSTDGSVGVFKYHTNNGNTITLDSSPQVTGLTLTGVTNTTQTNFPSGSLIQECNANGILFSRHLGHAQMGVLAGDGVIDGAVAVNGQRTEETRNHGMDHGIGLAYCWGVQPYQRVDGLYPGFLVIETAMPSAA